MPSDLEIEAAADAYIKSLHDKALSWSCDDLYMRIIKRCMKAALEAAEKVRGSKPCKCLTPHHYSCNAKEDK